MLNNNNAPNILLIGNGSYRNRGCEAIVRGTIGILRSEFGSEVKVRSGVMAAPDVVTAQNAQETDPSVRSFSISEIGPRGSLKWWLSQANKRLGTTFQHHVWDLHRATTGVLAALEVGGDNYSLDYGRPLRFMAMDRYLKSRGIPLIIWGASVGPFDKDKEYAPHIFKHLQGVDGIFVRETASLEYLHQNGISRNVRLVADPAFLMEPVEPRILPREFRVHAGTIGINLSPLMARFCSGNIQGSGLEAWKLRASELVMSVLDQVDRPVLLIPHVSSPNYQDDDFSFLESLRTIVQDKSKIPVGIVPLGLNAEESKWVISQCAVFAGARTHSTIAALSSCVPTLTLSYSIKAQGINRDLFGHLEYCQPVAGLTPVKFVEGISLLLRDESKIREHLAAKMPSVRASALDAGRQLRDTITRYHAAHA